MTMRAKLAALVGRCNRKILGAAAVCALVAAVAVGHGIGAHAYDPAGSVAPQVPSSTGAAAPAAIEPSGSDGTAITGDAEATGDLDSSDSQPTYTPHVDDLMPPTVSYDEGTGDQSPYIPAFDAGD